MMQPLKSSDKCMKKPRSAANLLLVTIADTTWRAFVPTIGGTIFGIWLDHSIGATPWCTALSITTGVAISTMLIIMQIKGVKK